MKTSAKHETRALLRAHLAAATSYRHFTRHCPVCHRLLRLAMEHSPGPSADDEALGALDAADGPVGPVGRQEEPSPAPVDPAAPSVPDTGRDGARRTTRETARDTTRETVPGGTATVTSATR